MHSFYFQLNEIFDYGSFLYIEYLLHRINIIKRFFFICLGNIFSICKLNNMKFETPSRHFAVHTEFFICAQIFRLFTLIGMQLTLSANIYYNFIDPPRISLLTSAHLKSNIVARAQAIFIVHIAIQSTSDENNNINKIENTSSNLCTNNNGKNP